MFNIYVKWRLRANRAKLATSETMLRCFIENPHDLEHSTVSMTMDKLKNDVAMLSCKVALYYALVKRVPDARALKE